MTIANEATYIARRDFPQQRVSFTKNSLTTVAARTYSSWLAGGVPGAGTTPTTGVTCDRTTTGALAQLNTGSGSIFQRILKFRVDLALTGGMVTIADRLAHSGGLTGIGTAAQTTNLPTPTLTRKTSGVGVMGALEIYSAIGTSVTAGTYATVAYTDTASASQTTPGFDYGRTGFSAASRLIMLPLVAGGTGMKTITGFTCTVSSGTAGNFGAVLLYPYVSVPIDHMLPMADEAEALYGFGPWFPAVDDDACLFFLYHTNGTATGLMQGDVFIGEDA